PTPSRRRRSSRLNPSSLRTARSTPSRAPAAPRSRATTSPSTARGCSAYTETHGSRAPPPGDRLRATRGEVGARLGGAAGLASADPRPRGARDARGGGPTPLPAVAAQGGRAPPPVGDTGALRGAAGA